MAQCKNCGTQLKDGMKFCDRCGAKVEAAPAQQQNPQAQQMQAQQQAPQAQQMQAPQQGQPMMQGQPQAPPYQAQQQAPQYQQMPPQGQQFGQQGQFQQQPYQQAPQGQQWQQQAQPQQNVPMAGPVDSNLKLIAVLMYIFPVLFFIPIIMNPKTAYGTFHANCALMMLIVNVAGIIINIIPILGQIVSFVLGIFGIVLFVCGIINVVKNTMKPLPLVGKFANIIK